MPLCSEAASGYCCDPGLCDQTKAERLGAKAEGTDIREGIKRALRDGAAKPHRMEAAQHQRPPFCVGLAHWRRVGFQRRLTGVLEHTGRAGQNMPVERSELSDDRRAAHEISDAPARHRPRL